MYYIELNDEFYKNKDNKIVATDIAEHFNEIDSKCIFVSFLNKSSIILCIFENGELITLDTADSFKILKRLNVNKFYPNLGPMQDRVVIATDSWHRPSGYKDVHRKRKFQILSAVLNENKNSIAWIESEYEILYYLQIYSLNMILNENENENENDDEEKKSSDNKEYLITSRLISQNIASSNGVNYDRWYREQFVNLMKERSSTEWRQDLSLKIGNTTYVVGTMASCNRNKVKLIFNPNADKLLYSSVDSMHNDLLVIDRNTMTTQTVTCKGTPSGWIFNDYLMVSQLGIAQDDNVRKFATLDIQGFVTETSIAEYLMEIIDVEDDGYEAFPWYLCLIIGCYVGSSREFRDITLINWELKEYDNDNNKYATNVLLETTSCDDVWMVMIL